jgi:hypothetical protein
VCSPRTQYPLPAALAFDPGAATTIYAGTRLQGYCLDCGDPLPTQSNGVYKSLDSGQTWTAVNTGLPLMSGTGSTYDVVALAAVPGQPGTLYAAVNDPSISEAPGRVYKTVNGGATWAAADQGITGVSVRSLRVDPATQSRVCGRCGQGHARWRLHDARCRPQLGLDQHDLPVDSAHRSRCRAGRPGHLARWHRRRRVEPDPGSGWRH